MALTVRQEKFCLEYAASGNAYQSALAAGYSENYAKGNAVKLVENVSVKAKLQELREKVESDKIADIKEMQEILTNIIRQGTTEEVVVTEGIGDGMSEARIINKKPSFKDVNNAINTLARMQGGFIDKLRMEVEPVTIIDDLKE